MTRQPLYTTKFPGGTIVTNKKNIGRNYVVVGRASYMQDDERLWIIPYAYIGYLCDVSQGCDPTQTILRGLPWATIADPDDLELVEHNGFNLGTFVKDVGSGEEMIIIGVDMFNMDGSRYTLAVPNGMGKAVGVHWINMTVDSKEEVE